MVTLRSEHFTKLDVTVERKGRTPIVYTLPQTGIPVLKMIGAISPQYKFSCSTEGLSIEQLEKVTLTWKFLKHVEVRKKGTVTDYESPVELKAGENGRHVVYARSFKKSHFMVTEPSSKINGVYYCEWMTPFTVQRSPTFEIFLTGKDKD